MPATLDAPPIVAEATLPEGVPYRFGVADFYRMIDLDVFPRESRVGLWDGQVYEKMSKNPPHSVSGTKIVIVLLRLLPPGWFPSIENPITLAPDKAPLPDVAVIRGIPDDYCEGRPAASDVGLIVEVSDSSLRIDTKVKLAAYAKAGIPAYWVVNLAARVVQVYESPIPEEGRFDSARSFAPGTSIPLNLDGVNVGPFAVDEVLPLR